jgi:hypothetical protein
MNNVGKLALYGLTQPTVGTFFLENHLRLIWFKLKATLPICQTLCITFDFIHIKGEIGI